MALHGVDLERAASMQAAYVVVTLSAGEPHQCAPYQGARQTEIAISLAWKANRYTRRPDLECLAIDYVGVQAEGVWFAGP